MAARLMRMALGNVIAILFGLGFVAAGVVVHLYMDRFLATGVEASGVVVDVVYEPGSRQARMHPVMRFKTADGLEVLGRSWQHHNSEVGQALQLVYDPKNPEHVEIGTLSELRRFRTIMAAVGPCTYPAGPCIRPVASTTEQLKKFLRLPAFGGEFDIAGEC